METGKISIIIITSITARRIITFMKNDTKYDLITLLYVKKIYFKNIMCPMIIQLALF
jgi:hypothetical protein